MQFWPLSPVWFVDFLGSTAMIVLSAQCLYLVRRLLSRDPDSPLAHYLFWFVGAIFAFSTSRSLGHIIKHLLYFSGRRDLWQQLAPVSGSINSITFVVIASVTLFFHRIQAIMERMARDRERLEKTSQEVLELNKNIDIIVSERTREEMALRFAHELRNPAMIIGGLMRRLLNSTQGECLKETKRLQRVVAEARKLEELVSSFEHVQSKMEKKIVPLELSELVEDVLEVIGPDASRKDITILLDRSSTGLDFQGNRQLLKSALLHIIRNAIEACGAGNTIQITSELADQGLALKIQDDGPGIPQEILDHIYEPFYMTGEGETGIGIPFVKQIVTEHKGSMTIKSKAQGGTTVEILLPTHLGSLQKK